MSKKAIIIGAGPAGLTAAYELLERSDIKPLLLEENDFVGGISATLDYKNNKIDMGGHRFFSKSERVMNWWLDILPLQGKPSKDDILLDRTIELSPLSKAPNPEKTDKVMLRRNRLSRIFYLKTFFNYPVSLNMDTIRGLGLWRMFKIGCSYLKALAFPIKDEKSLEDFMINRFGRELYLTFFKDYTEKLWGIDCNKISAEWGAQRIKGISILKVIKQMFNNLVGKKGGAVETSFIESFFYPKFGPGHLWQNVADIVTKKGGEIRFNEKVSRIIKEDNKIIAVETTDAKGNKKVYEGDIFISTMPVKDLILSMNDTPSSIQEIADGLMYRDFRVVGVLLDKLKLKNNTAIKTVNNIIPDTWIYVQERDVKLGRVQVFNNWSPYLVDDFKNKVWIGLEYFCNENDHIWTDNDKDFIEFAIGEADKIGIFDKNDVVDTCTHKVKKAYPAYFGTYDKFDEIKNYVNDFENLYLVGRNGMHRYNNMDHSTLAAMKTVDLILGVISNKDEVWSVNTESDYHEEKKAA
ncbi:MAG: NAD(P)/FAD-dependent oxidoreductase [Alphaproteobacteria bacterium]|nr:NAD(P)/FAD-dependent oxidoreductase [Alphaproteobacteria bacterium]